MRKHLIATLATAYAVGSFAHTGAPAVELTRPLYALTSLDLLAQAPASLKVLEKDVATGTAVVSMDEDAASFLSRKAHEKGRCGGFEALPELGAVQAQAHKSTRQQARRLLADLRTQTVLQSAPTARVSLELIRRDSIANAANQVQSANVRDTVTWFSAFNNRYNRDPQANVPVQALRDKLALLVKDIPGATVDLISHNSTPQKSIRVHLPGTSRPSEIVVLGGHLDSINGWGRAGVRAPGADDNASGVASLTEALRIVATLPRTARSVEFFFYAGEESGLLGSAEIAQDYRSRNVDVVGVLQLDMTLHPGSGSLVIASMTDFTNAWMRELVVELNRHYVNARVVEDKCGYGCSDHASWFRRGYPTAMPFEARFDDMNHSIHTLDDVINSRSDFEHAAAFSKLAVSLALELGDSTARAPASRPTL